MKAFLKNVLSSKIITKFITSFGSGWTVILMYHDLREDDDFENWLRVSVSDFDNQLTRLREIGDFISPDELFSAAPGQRLRFLITFDDGFYNNFKFAVPILRRHRVPALFFVSTGHLQEQQPFWPDIIVTPIQILKLDRLDLSRFQLGVFEFHPVGSAERWDDIDELLKSLKNLGNIYHPTVAAVLQHMYSEFAETLAEHLPRFRPLNVGELAKMSTDPLFHIGSHGHYHDILIYQDSSDVDESLQSSQRILNEMTGGRIAHLAYPNGDYNARIMTQAERAGYTCAYTNDDGIVNSQTPAMALPRLGIGGVGSCSLPFFKLNQVLVGAMWKRVFARG